MGRGKLNMELIKKEKSRMITYHKRKKGLLKKASEFSILCAVDTCVIIYGPSVNGHPSELETFPPSDNQVIRILNKYKGNGNVEIRGKKTFDLSDFFAARQKKLEDELTRLRKANMEANFPTWDDRLNSLPNEQLRLHLSTIDIKLELAKRRLLKLNGDQYLNKEPKSGLLSISNTNQSTHNPFIHSPSMYPKSSELEVINQQPIPTVVPLDMQLPLFYPPHNQTFQMLPFNFNPIDNPMMKLLNNGENVAQFGGATSSSSIPVPQFKGPVYYDPATAMLENAMFNNPTALPRCYYGAAMQPMSAYGHSSMMPDVPSKRPAPKFADFCNFNGFDMNNKKARP